MQRRALLFALVLLAFGAVMLHFIVHPAITTGPGGSFRFNITLSLADLFPLVDLVVVTLLFLSRKTSVYGYLLNGLLVIYGSVFMGHFSIARFMTEHIPPSQWFTHSLLIDIGILWADFFVGKALFDYYGGNK